MIGAFSLPFLLVEKKTEPRVEFSSSRSVIRLWLVTLERKFYVFWMAKDSCRISCIRQWRAHLIWLGCVFMVIPLTLSTLTGAPNEPFSQKMIYNHYNDNTTQFMLFLLFFFVAGKKISVPHSQQDVWINSSSQPSRADSSQLANIVKLFPSQQLKRPKNYTQANTN